MFNDQPLNFQCSGEVVEVSATIAHWALNTALIIEHLYCQ